MADIRDNEIPLPPTPAPSEPSSAAELIRHARRELRLVQESLAREREQLDRVRSVLASQRLVMTANEQQIATWRDGLVAERERLEQAVATLTQRREELAREVPAMEARQAQFDRELSTGRADLKRQVETELASAKQQADSIRQSAQAEARGMIDSVRAQIEQIRVASQRDAERSTQSARQQAEVIIASARARTDELAMEAGRIIEQARHEADDLRRSAAEEKARVSADLADRAAQAEVARKASEADLARRTAEVEQARVTAEEDLARRTASAKAEQSAAETDLARRTADSNADLARRTAAAKAQLSAAETDLAHRAADVNADIARRSEALQQQVADADHRQSAVREDETRLAELQSKLAEQQQLLARESADLARRRHGLANSEQKIHEREISLKQKIADTDAAIRQKQIDFDAQLRQKFADVETAIARRQAEAETDLAARRAEADASIAARHAHAEADLARRIAEAESTTAALAELEQSLAEHSQQLNRKESDLEHGREQLARRRAEVDRLHGDASADRATAAALRQQVEVQALQCEQELAQVKSKSEQLAADLESVRRQRATADRLTADLEAKTDQIRATERQVLGGWDEVRREHATVIKVRAELDRERGELAAALAMAKAPSVRIIERRMSWSAYGRWAAVLGIATAAVLLISELTVFFAAGPVSEASGRLHMVAVEEMGNTSPADEALDEVQAFLGQTQTANILRGPEGLHAGGADWRVEVMPTDSPQKSATLAVCAQADSPDAAKQRADELGKSFSDWREEKLKSVAGSGSAEELQKKLAAAQVQRDTAQLAAQSVRAAIDELFKENHLDALGPCSAVDALCAVDVRLGEFDGAVKTAQVELAKVSGDLWAWQTEAQQLRQQSSAGSSPPDPARLAADLRVAKDQAQKTVAMDRSVQDRIARSYDERLAAAGAALRSARAEWTAAADGLIAAIASHDTRTSDPAVTGAARRFEKAQIAYTDAQAGVDPDQDRLLRTWSQQLAEVKDRIASHQSDLDKTAAALDRAERLVKLAGLIDSAQKRADQLTGTIQTGRTTRLALSADRATFASLARQADSAQAAYDQWQSQLARLDGVSLARVWSARESAKVIWSHNDRPLWMLVTAALILAIATGAGLLAVLILSRPREQVLDGATLAAGGVDAVLKIARLASAGSPAAVQSAGPGAAQPGGVASN